MKTKINVFCLAHGELEAKVVQALVKLYTTTDMFEPSYCRTQEINPFNKVNLDLPWCAGTVEMVRGAGGWTDLIWTVTTVVFIVTHPLGGDAASPSTGKLWLQTGRGGRRASHTITLPNTLLTGAEHTKAKGFYGQLIYQRQKQRIHIYKCSERLTSSGSVEWQQLQLETRSHPTHTDTGWELHSCRLFHKKHTDKERKDGSGSLWVRLKKDIQNSCSYLILVVRRSWFQILWSGEEAKIVLSVRAVFTRVSVSMTPRQVRSRH